MDISVYLVFFLFFFLKYTLKYVTLEEKREKRKSLPVHSRQTIHPSRGKSAGGLAGETSLIDPGRAVQSPR